MYVNLSTFTAQGETKNAQQGHYSHKLHFCPTSIDLLREVLFVSQLLTQRTVGCSEQVYGREFLFDRSQGSTWTASVPDNYCRWWVHPPSEWVFFILNQWFVSPPEKYLRNMRFRGFCALSTHRQWCATITIPRITTSQRQSPPSLETQERLSNATHNLQRGWSCASPRICTFFQKRNVFPCQCY